MYGFSCSVTMIYGKNINLEEEKKNTKEYASSTYKLILLLTRVINSNTKKNCGPQAKVDCNIMSFFYDSKMNCDQYKKKTLENKVQKYMIGMKIFFKLTSINSKSLMEIQFFFYYYHCNMMICNKKKEHTHTNINVGLSVNQK